MRRRLHIFSAIVLLLASSAAAQRTTGRATAPATRPEPWTKIAIPPLPAFHPRQPVRLALSNGMVLFLQENHELPLISANIRIRGGSREEPAAKVGMVDIYGEAWRTGGTKTRTGDQFDDFLEARAAKVETNGGTDSTFIGMNCLKEDFDDVFAVFLDLLQNPEFREDKIELAKRQMTTSIARRNDDPDEIAEREGDFLAYGRENPYARIAEYATVAAVSRQDLIAWHERFVHPNNMILGVSGDFDAKEMEARLRRVFESWPRGPQAEPPKIDFPQPKPGLYFVAKGDVNQSSIRMVGLGIERRNPDYYALTVMNEVLGGGFSSRLFTSIRTKQGLAYDVSGGIGSAFDHPGRGVFALGTKSVSTVEAIRALRNELADMVKKPASVAEINRAKDSILNSFIFRFDSPEKILRERMAYEYYGYPADFLERYRAGIEKITPADVARVVEKYLHPEQMALLVVGNPGEIEPPLNSLGQVTTLDITIPPPAEAASAMPEAQETQ